VGTSAYRRPASRVLKGEKPSDLPVQQSSKVEQITNLSRSASPQPVSHIRTESDDLAKTINESGEKPLGLDRRRVADWHELRDAVGHTLHAAAAYV
jgi:hypothetical protein